MIMIKKLLETSSTNEYLMDLIKQCHITDSKLSEIKSKIPEFFSVYTCTQKDGRGQRGNTWHSEIGKNCLTSMIVYPTILASEQYFISKAITLGVLDLLKELIVDHKNLSIKWPNDLYYGDKKLAGILIENSIIGSEINYSIIGVGLNLNQTNFPAYLPNPISVTQITEMFYDMEEVTKNLIKCIADRYSKMISSDIHVFDEEFLYSMYKFKANHCFVINQKPIEASIQGVSEYGNLQLLVNNSEVIECGFKEVSFHHEQ